MLKIKQKKSGYIKRWPALSLAALLFAGGLYMLTLVGAPALSPIIAAQQINVNSLKEPTVGADRIVIPKIGVDIEFGESEAWLDNGAQWRHPDHGNPKDGGNFILAAHRFSLAPTPQETIRKSPFFHIDKLVPGDEIVVDYDGKRYGYKVSKVFDVEPNQTEIESADTKSRLTLYSCGLGGADDKRVVIYGDPLGEVTISSLSNQNS